ncbi:hypothetical protein H0243_02200 [Staphylococcus sciuri]|uniref:hypothetical protein n=1 Tax=Mammaliicoccus sciuri TaxID=1296 RepID=UPI0018CA5E07|nr:hypothetical protein [Mammaliicoccus sciuri]MBG9204585.1 hypothetical protein [Mammaliicoccus sciuri]MEB7394281.1 hypothetical protein [Mammaliicoccus sciuri]MEB8142368.1 hypothetical protein [Mammaliicoccus sciuri]
MKDSIIELQLLGNKVLSENEMSQLNNNEVQDVVSLLRLSNGETIIIKSELNNEIKIVEAVE